MRPRSASAALAFGLCLMVVDGGSAQDALQLPNEIVELEEVRGLAAVPVEAWERLAESLPRLQEIQNLWEDRILAISGVNSIGIGEVAGEARFLVGAQPGYDVSSVPDEIEGVPVVVERREPTRLLDGVPNCTPPCHVEQPPAPIPALMGVSARWFRMSGGCTAGFKACDLGSGRQVFVTNAHCAQFSNGCAMASTGDPVWSPARNDGPHREIGRIAGHAPPMCGIINYTDATKVDSTAQESSFLIRDIGFAGRVPAVELLPGELVTSSGRTTGLKWGVVTAVNVTIAVPGAGGFCCGPVLMARQNTFKPLGDGIVLGGDSGSAVVRSWRWRPPQGHPFVPSVAGLLFGNDDQGAHFNSIFEVLHSLNLTLDLARCP